jgi:hypothetical protein
MRGIKTMTGLRVLAAGHAFVQNLRRGHYEIAADQPRNLRLAIAFGQLADKVDALYAEAPGLPADAIGPKMARLRREHHRLLGNGYCTRPPQIHRRRQCRLVDPTAGRR